MTTGFFRFAVAVQRSVSTRAVLAEPLVAPNAKETVTPAQSGPITVAETKAIYEALKAENPAFAEAVASTRPTAASEVNA